MKAIYGYLSILTIVLLLSGLAATEIEIEDQDEKNCSSSFSPYQIGRCCEPKVICAHISHERLNWDDAKFHCSLLFAQLSQQIHFKSSLRIDLLKKGIDIVWMGIRRRNNFFVTEYPSKLFREADSFSSDYWGYHWADNEPGPDDCVALNITNGSLLTRSCADSLPFVCDDDVGKDIGVLLQYFSCPEGWKLSFPLSSTGRTCISLQEPSTYYSAEEFCLKNDGRLATFKEYTILSTSEIFSSLDDVSFWIKKKNFKICEVTRNIKGHMSNVFPMRCTIKHPFLCVKNYKEYSIKVNLSPKSIQPIASDSGDAADLLTCDVENEFSELNIETDLLFQWYKDDLPISVNSYVIRLSFIGDVLKRDPYTTDIASRQGFYHCEVQLPGNTEIYSSSKLKFTYTEIHGIKQNNDFDYSHQHFSQYMDDFEEASMNNVFEKISFRYAETQWDFVSKSIVNGESVMKIVVYIYKSGIENFDERMACEELKDAFQGLNSIPVFMENMSVHINCEEFPIRNGYVSVLKSLQTIEDKLNRIEDKQEDILLKLRECERSRHVEAPDNEYEFDADMFLGTVDELKSVDYSLFHKRPEVAFAERGNDERERNELEEDFYALIGKAKEPIGSKIITSYSSKNEPTKDRKEDYIYYTGNKGKGTTSRRITFQKDL